MAKVSLVRT